MSIRADAGAAVATAEHQLEVRSPFDGSVVGEAAVLAITPFNFPLNLVAHKVAPALAAGNPVIVKPASATPLSALALAALLAEDEWPAGAVTVLPVSGRRASLIAADERVRGITFTG